MPTSIVTLAGKSTQGELEHVKDLLGLRIHSVGGGSDKLYALGDEGTYDVFTSTKVNDVHFESVSAGSHHVVGLAQSDGRLYSWGVAEFGELGTGIMAGEVPVAKEVRTSQGPFTSFATGANHSMAIDSSGVTVAWGQNFERQLGLFKKTQSQLDEPRKQFCPNVMVEEMLTVPRLIPFCLHERVARVACGAQFTVLLTKQGVLWTFGAGECGQLGTGRVTSREIPVALDAPVMPGVKEAMNNKQKWIDVACGSGHVLALSSSQRLYGWGFNKRGQLGLGDTMTRFEPTLLDFVMPEPFPAGAAADGGGVNATGSEAGSGASSAPSAVGLVPGSVAAGTSTTSGGMHQNASEVSLETPSASVVLPPPEPIVVAQLVADDNSSACVLSSGALYTWGCGQDYRLCNGEEKHVHEPVQVVLPACDRVTRFAFSRTHAAFVIPTALDRISPEVGPQKSMKMLELFGPGLWDSEDIVVKFTCVHNPFIPARSCIGHLQSPGVVSCKPPRLAEAGDYEVTLSLNGRDFAPQKKHISMYPDPTINSVKPRLVDMRNLVDMPKGAPKNAKRKGLEMVVVGTNFEPLNPEEKPDLIVRLNDTANADRPFIDAPAKLLDLPKETKPVRVGDDEDEEEDTSTIVTKVLKERTIKCVMLKKDLMDAGRLLIMTTQVSLNGGTDFSVDSDDALVVHSFEGERVDPPCQPAAVGRVVEVHGASFLPPSIAEYEALVSVSLPETAADKKKKKAPPKAGKDKLLEMDGLHTMAVSVEYVSPELLRMHIPSVEEFLRDFAAVNDYVVVTPSTSVVLDQASLNGEDDAEDAEPEPDVEAVEGDEGGTEEVEPTEPVVEESPEVTDLRNTLSVPMLNVNIGFRFRTGLESTSSSAASSATSKPSSTTPKPGTQLGQKLITLPMYRGEEVASITPVMMWDGNSQGTCDMVLTSEAYSFLPGGTESTKVCITSPEAPHLHYVVDATFEAIMQKKGKKGEEPTGFYRVCFPCPDVPSITALANVPPPKPEPIPTKDDHDDAAVDREDMESGADGEANAEPVVEALPDAENDVDADAAAGEEEEEEEEMEPITLQSLLFGVMLDGVTAPPVTSMASMTLFGNVEILTDGGMVAVAKGGALPETEQVLACRGLVRSDVCKVRIRDVNGVVCETDGEIMIGEAEEGDVDEDMNISFVIPAGVTGEGFMGHDPEETGTTRFYVDVSLDGMHYDESPEPILHIKVD